MVLIHFFFVKWSLKITSEFRHVCESVLLFVVCLFFWGEGWLFIKSSFHQGFDLPST